MYKLKTVCKLDLSMNDISDLPRSPAFFAKMTALEFLALDNNNLATLDNIKGLGGAAKLSYLSLDDNPI